MGKTTGCGTNCTALHPFNEGRRDKCNKIKNCVCRCETLKSMNINLFEGCKGACQNTDNQPKDGKDYLYNYLDPLYVYEHYQIVLDGFDPLNDTQAGQNYQDFNKNVDEQTNFERIIIGVLILVVFAIGYFLFFGSSKKKS